MIITLKQAAQQALEALEEIALAGMSGTGQESEEGMRDWHARQAWKFIGIAARALDPLRTAIQQAEAKTDEPVFFVSPAQARAVNGKNRFHYTPSDNSGRYLPVRATPAGLFTQPVYTHPAPGVPGALKDHQIAAMVNSLRDIARQFHGHDSLRERIANVLVPALKAEAKTDEPVVMPIYQCQLANGSWIDQSKHSYEYNVKHGQATVRVVYTHPAPGVPDDVVKDAERYRWLRKWKGQEHEPPFTVQHEFDWTIWGGDLDSAIDAAMHTAAQAQKGQP